MIKIKPLSNYPDQVQNLAGLWIENIGSIYFPNITKEQIANKIQGSMNEDMLPLTFVAMDGNKAVGMAGLRDNDTTVTSFGKTPCLSGVCVDKEYQNKGIGKLLVDTIKSEAFKLGFKVMWRSALSKEVADWYENMGWEISGQGDVSGVPAYILKINLTHEDLR